MIATIDGYQTQYDVQGPTDAPVLVLSNSLGADLRMWDAQTAPLARRWRVVRYDTRGHGRSGVTPGEYTIVQLASDVVHLLDFLDVDQAHVCGMSMGGMIGLYHAQEYPDRIRKLAVCSSAARIGTGASWDGRIAAVREGGMRAIVASVMTRWFTDGFRARYPTVVHSFEQQFVDTPVDGYAACCAAIRDADLRAAVPKIRSPVLVLAGAHDPVVSTTDAQWLAGQVPGGEYDELPTAHLSNVESPAAFTERLSRFLSA
jgi:3-oxoadipate enol-lactonase